MSIVVHSKRDSAGLHEVIFSTEGDGTLRLHHGGCPNLAASSTREFHLGEMDEVCKKAGITAEDLAVGALRALQGRR